jgi:hypothetical protein
MFSLEIFTLVKKIGPSQTLALSRDETMETKQTPQTGQTLQVGLGI